MAVIFGRIACTECYKCGVVCLLFTSVSPTKLLNQSRCHLKCGLGWAPGGMYSMGAQIPFSGRSNFGGTPCDVAFRENSLTTCWLICAGNDWVNWACHVDIGHSADWWHMILYCLVSQTWHSLHGCHRVKAEHGAHELWLLLLLFDDNCFQCCDVIICQSLCSVMHEG